MKGRIVFRVDLILDRKHDLSILSKHCSERLVSVFDGKSG